MTTYVTASSPVYSQRKYELTLSHRNYKNKLDPALIRPGRADTIVEFKNASRHVCHDLFKVFYPVTGKFPVRYARSSDVSSMEKSPSILTENEVESLATAFAAAIPEYEFSPAQIQGKSSFNVISDFALF
jgi:chaperone BCS1